MPSISQQDYIIIDWEGKDDNDAEKKAEVDAILVNLAIANPTSLLSVVFKNYGFDSIGGGVQLSIAIDFSIDGTTESKDCVLFFPFLELAYSFSLL